MKTVKFLLTVTTAAVVAIASAVEKPKMDVVTLNADRAVISITNENPALFEMSIETTRGDVVYYKQSNEPITSYQKTFDFANLENGSYVFNLKVNDTKLSKDFTVNSKNILFGDSKLRFDPYFSFKDNELKLSYLNFDEENVNISFYNEGGVVYQKKLGSDFAIMDGYDLSKLEDGKYRVVLSGFKNQFEYNLEK